MKRDYSNINIVALDIETLEKPIPAALEEEARQRIEARNNERFKTPAVIETHNKEDLESWRNKWKFTRRGAQVLAVGFGWFDASGKVVELYCKADGDEAVVVKAAWEYFAASSERLGAYAPTLYTFNGDHFDWPHLIRASVAHECYPPYRIHPKSHTDLMQHPFERFVGQSEDLDGLCDIYGIKLPPQLTIEDWPNPDGSQVAAMWEADCRSKEMGFPGRRVETYCLQDVYKVGQLAAKIGKVIQV